MVQEQEEKEKGSTEGRASQPQEESLVGTLRGLGFMVITDEDIEEGLLETKLKGLS